MKNSDSLNITYLSLVAAKARQLSEDLQNGKLWEGDLKKGLSEIRSQIGKVKV